MNRAKYIFRLIFLVVAMQLATSSVFAASLEKIEVASHLGEPFYAEIPLRLEEGELISELSIEIASLSDYRIFEIYRDTAVGAIRVDISNDARGPRIQLSSTSEIKSPFFNLIIKTRYGRVAHFKKYPLFLETESVVAQVSEKKPLPTVQKVAQSTDSVEQGVVAVESTPEKEDIKRFDGWARTNRYGPIIRGDALSTVARRLMVDDRYTLSQVAVALFEKNRSSFDQNNMGFLQKNSFLDVPTADEVERFSKKEAYRVFVEHEQRRQEIKSQLEHAVDEVQRTHYTKQISVGEIADGVAKASLPAELADHPLIDDIQKKGAAVQTFSLVDLQAQNELLQQKLEQSEKSVADLSQKLDAVESAASLENIKKLEVLVARLQKDLSQAREEVAKLQTSGADWVLWVLAALVVVLLVVIAQLMRRDPVHPSESAVQYSYEKPDADKDSSAVKEEKEGDNSSPSDDNKPVVAEKRNPGALGKVVAESNVDHLSEASVYMRYGMEEEALQQLDLALQKEPENEEAHIRKVELLHKQKDVDAFQQAKSAAVSSLAGSALEKFNVAVDGLDNKSQENPGQPNASESESVGNSLEIDKEVISGSEEGATLDYDVSGIADALSAGGESDLAGGLGLEDKEIRALLDSFGDGPQDISLRQNPIDIENATAAPSEHDVDMIDESISTQDLQSVFADFSEWEDGGEKASTDGAEEGSVQKDPVQSMASFELEEDLVSSEDKEVDKPESGDETQVPGEEPSEGQKESLVTGGEGQNPPEESDELVQELDYLLSKFDDEEKDEEKGS